MHSENSMNSSLDLTPMGREMAVKLVRRLLAGYSNLTAPDPQAYLAALVETMESYPQWAGERAIMRVEEENNQFPPSEKGLRVWLEEIVRPARFIAQHNERSAEQLAERDRLERLGKETDVEHRTKVVNRVLGDLQEWGFKFKSLGDAAAKATQAQEPPYDDRDVSETA